MRCFYWLGQSQRINMSSLETTCDTNHAVQSTIIPQRVSLQDEPFVSSRQSWIPGEVGEESVSQLFISQNIAALWLCESLRCHRYVETSDSKRESRRRVHPSLLKSQLRTSHPFPSIHAQVLSSGISNLSISPSFQRTLRPQRQRVIISSPFYFV